MQIQRRTAFAAGLAAVALPILGKGASAQTAAAAPAMPGSPGFYKFKVGSFTVTTVHDGSRAVPLTGFVRNAPIEDVQRVLAESFLPTDQLRIPFTVTVVEAGANLIVFDSGNGAQPGPSPVGLFMANFRAAGYDPARVTHVIVSHFHADHINGLIDAGGARTFPNAAIMVPETEWAWWMDEGNSGRTPENQRGNFANSARRFAPWRADVQRFADGAAILPGIRAHAAYGHTPGHTTFHIADGGDQMMLLVDVTNRPELLARRPDFHIVFDTDPVVAEASRRRAFDRVASDRIRVTGYHFPFPAQGYVAKEGNGYRFIPGDWSAGI
ncbi:MAG: Glyoxylase, beta-lactamase superfamily [Rhodospirillales bacterium]|jgi:glyoxylase-like metal-dependent hydrolase (beta-lactamase superfamily II)|nr:Glyoxylase, beta-lactamase superfamily [Rhodospirillales bacterium]